MQLHFKDSTVHLSFTHFPAGLAGALQLDQLDATPIASTVERTPPAPGDYWPGEGGHFICTLPALQGLPARHLIAAKDEAEDLRFGATDDVQGATSRTDGRANTAALLAHGSHPAANYAVNHSADGHTDFFLPSQLDLFMALIHAPQLFKKEGWYWSSTQTSRICSFAQSFGSGDSHWSDKDYELLVRPFRVIHLGA